jgi:hypothetical protein
LLIFNKYKVSVLNDFQLTFYFFKNININKKKIDYNFNYKKSIARFLLFLNCQHYCYYYFSFFFFKGTLKFFVTFDFNNYNFISFKSLNKLNPIT